MFDSIPSPDAYSYTTLLSSYAKSGRLCDAFQLFDESPQRTTPVWNAMITGCIDSGYSDVASQLFVRMHRLGIGMDQYSFAGMISICDLPELVGLGLQLHSMVAKTGLVVSRVSVVNALVTMYFDCGLIGEARRVFDEAMVRDEVSYNAVVSGMVQWGRGDESLMVFKEMREKACFMPTELTLVSVLSACSMGKVGWQVHALAVKVALDSSLLVSNALITMYSDCGEMAHAQNVFVGITDKDIVSWNSIIAGYNQHDCFESAIGLYYQMLWDAVQPDDFTFGSLIACASTAEHAVMFHAVVIKNGLISSAVVCNSIISAYSKRREIDSAYKAFHEMFFRSLVSWNSIIAGCVLNGLPIRGVELFSDMLQSGLEPNTYTLSTLLSASASIAAFRFGKEIHCYILKTSNFETSLENALITLYAKCGDLSYASKVFCRMPWRDVVSWNAIIAAYAQNGDGYQAIRYFKMMHKSKIIPDQVTFMIVLSACSHSGMVDEGRLIFSSMLEYYGIVPGVDHYSCIVDLLGRAGHLDEAERMINSMQYRVDSRVWWTLLSACITHRNVSLGKVAAKFILEHEPSNAAVHVLLSNLIAANGQWEEATSVRDDMRKNRVMKEPASSWI